MNFGISLPQPKSKSLMFGTHWQCRYLDAAIVRIIISPSIYFSSECSSRQPKPPARQRLIQVSHEGQTNARHLCQR
jgi:hypothetical protein